MSKIFYPTVNGQTKEAILQNLQDDVNDYFDREADHDLEDCVKLDPKKLTDQLAQTIVNELTLMYDEGVDTDEEDLVDEQLQYSYDIYTKFFK